MASALPARFTQTSLDDHLTERDVIWYRGRIQLLLNALNEACDRTKTSVPKVIPLWRTENPTHKLMLAMMTGIEAQIEVINIKNNFNYPRKIITSPPPWVDGGARG